MTSLVEIEGVAESPAAMVDAAKLGTVESLLSQGATPAP
jgi:hypothetical protein